MRVMGALGHRGLAAETDGERQYPCGHRNGVHFAH
jgi:hypothetical protein